MNLPPLILASASPRRSELLRTLKLDFQIVASDADEVHYDYLSAGELSQINASRKARAVSKKFPDALVAGFDTLVALDTKIFGKPRDLNHAKKMLQQLQGKKHYVVTGVCLVHLRSHRHRIFAEKTSVTFRPLNADEISRYHRSVNPLDKAGAYAIQENGDAIVADVSGSFSNVVGLPLEKFLRELKFFASD